MELRQLVDSKCRYSYFFFGIKSKLNKVPSLLKNTSASSNLRVRVFKLQTLDKNQYLTDILNCISFMLNNFVSLIRVHAIIQNENAKIKNKKKLQLDFFFNNSDHSEIIIIFALFFFTKSAALNQAFFPFI